MCAPALPGRAPGRGADAAAEAERGRARQSPGGAIASLLESIAHSAAGRQQLIEVITGAEALRQHLRQIQAAHGRDALVLQGPVRGDALGKQRAEFDALARGVRYRVLYERAFFDDEGPSTTLFREFAQVRSPVPSASAPAAGGRGPCHRGLPARARRPPGQPGRTHRRTRTGQNLLAALIALFERYWEDAVPLDVGRLGRGRRDGRSGGPDPLSAIDRRVLALLVAGVADKAVATQLGLSRRTVQRHIQRMMELAGAGPVCSSPGRPPAGAGSRRGDTGGQQGPDRSGGPTLAARACPGPQEVPGQPGQEFLPSVRAPRLEHVEKTPHRDRTGSSDRRQLDEDLPWLHRGLSEGSVGPAGAPRRRRP